MTSSRAAPRSSAAPSKDHHRPGDQGRPALAALLARRHQTLVETAEPGDLGAYSILAALVPVATRGGGEVAYPGDPMCLYAALGLTIARSVRRRMRGLGASPDVDDVYACWGSYPTIDYRVRESQARQVSDQDLAVTDGRIFDPRLWNPGARDALAELLQRARPAVMLLSAVSAAHRYALEMAAEVKRISPATLVILGGRHADETIGTSAAGQLTADWSSTVSVIEDGRAPAVIDFVVSGDGGPCLDLLLRAVGLSMSLPDLVPGPPAEILDLARLLARQEEVRGRGTIVALGDRGSHSLLSVSGPPLPRSGTPASYLPFSIRARFAVFDDPAGHPDGRRTAHLMTAATCPFSCSFCSESHAMGAREERLSASDVDVALGDFTRLVSWGAEAVFFDDPVFWSGNWQSIIAFAEGLARLRADSASGDLGTVEWGAQLTVDVLLNRARQPVIIEALRRMRSAGCTYIYVGIESMAAEVMNHVAKNLRRNSGQWKVKVRDALQLLSEAGIRAGSSVLFGLDGETRSTIAYTIEEIGRLIDDGLLVLASPNILTYHPGTPIRWRHRIERLDYHSRKQNREPYTYFEEAYPEVVTKLLSEDEIWYIHNACEKRWGAYRNRASSL